MFKEHSKKQLTYKLPPLQGTSFVLFRHHVKMAETDTTMVPQNTSGDTSQNGDFKTVKGKSRKRKHAQVDKNKESQMDTSETAVKRPHFAPISGDKLMVSHY